MSCLVWLVLSCCLVDCPVRVEWHPLALVLVEFVLLVLPAKACLLVGCSFVAPPGEYLAVVVVAPIAAEVLLPLVVALWSFGPVVRAVLLIVPIVIELM